MKRYALPVLGLFLLLSGCAATQLALEKKDLKVETLMSDTIFLDVENQTGKRVYIDVKNTSDKVLNIRENIAGKLAARGYATTDAANTADYILQVNILQVGRCDPSALRRNAGLGFGAPLTGGVVGGLIGAGTGSSTGVMTGVGIGALAGLGLEAVAGALVKDVTYSITTDVMISEKTAFDVKETQKAELAVGKGTTRSQRVARASNRQRYQTRIASYANKVNLSFEEALPALEEGLAGSVAGIF